MLFGGLETQTLVQVHAHPHSCFVDYEEPPQPRAEERDHLRISVREYDFAVTFRALARVERDAGNEERLIAEGTDASYPRRSTSSIWRRFAALRGGCCASVRPAAWSA